jgi:hypothetical protein
VWFYDKKVGEDVKLENDFQMHDLFEMYKDQMCCQVIVGVLDNCLRELDEFATLEPLCVIPPEFAHANQDPNSKDIPPGDGDSISPDDNHAAQPSNNPAGDADYPLEPELEPDRELDMFDNEEE